MMILLFFSPLCIFLYIMSISDMDENGHIVGLEILDASKRLDIADMVNISIENLPLEEVS